MDTLAEQLAAVPVDPAFEKTEYMTRVQRTRERMQELGIEVLLVADTANINYLTGYDGWSFYTPQVVIVALDADEPVWIGRGADANGARVTTSLQYRNIIGYPDHYVQATDLHPMDFVADFLRDAGWGRRIIGVEKDAYYFSIAGWEALTSRLPEATFRNAHLLVNWLRSVKSAAEIAYMQQAARIIEHTMAAGIEAVAPGVRQCDAAATILGAQARGTPEFGGDYTAIVPMLPSGIATSTPHLTWSDARFVHGEATVLELAAARRRYHCPMARTVFLGTPPTRLRDTAQVVVEGLDAALDTIRPGIRAQDVEAAWRRSIAASGIIKKTRLGYSIGIGYPPDWGEHTVSLRPGDGTVLAANMTFHCIAGLWLDDWGFEVSEAVRVTATGCETFCRFPRQLFVKP